MRTIDWNLVCFAGRQAGRYRFPFAGGGGWTRKKDGVTLSVHSRLRVPLSLIYSITAVAAAVSVWGPRFWCNECVLLLFRVRAMFYFWVLIWLVLVLVYQFKMW